MAQIKVKGILSYPSLFNARQIGGEGEPKYSVVLLISKNDPQLAQVQAVIEQEKANGFPSGFPPTGKSCLKDGATDPTFSQDPRMHNYMCVTMTNTDKPQIVDANLQPVMDPAQVYAGCEAWVSFGLQAYNKQVNKGVGAYVNGVMITGVEGELGRIDGRPTAEQMFGDVAGGAPAPQAAAPMSPPTQAAPAPAPVAAAPAPVPPPAAPAAPAPVTGLQMTAAAQGATYESMIAAGWTDETLLAQGMAIKPSFG